MSASTSPERFINRELSWLDFNARVLALSEDPRNGLLERVKFLAIFAQNLDEFFQVRVAGLKDQIVGGVGTQTPDGRTPAQQLLQIRDRVEELVTRVEDVFLDDVLPSLADNGIRLSTWGDLDEDDLKFLVEEFDEKIFPVLTPLAVDPGHPFPYISNLSLNLAVVVRDPDSGVERFARVKVPPLLARFVVLEDGERFIPLEQVIAANLGALFPGMEVVSHDAFRVSRNADLTLEEEEADDLLSMVEMELRRRRFGRAVRLEINESMSEEVRSFLHTELDLEDDDVYVHRGPIDLSGLWSVYGLDRPELKDPPWTPVTPERLVADDDDFDFFGAIRRSDILLQHPYDSFTASVESFIAAAAVDSKVQAIKMTLYRTSGDSQIVKSLIRAAERGIQVAVLIELKARFDEQANIEWAKRLEEAGVHVVYGLPGLKIHTKTTLVIRADDDRLRRYCHIGTGNYNTKTASLYEDIGLLTADDQLGDDLIQLFNFLTGFGRDIPYRKLLIAPGSLRPRMMELIEGEAHAGPGAGRIRMKMNSLVDPDMIDALYAASQAGVEIDLIVRGICCLRPGVPGLSERIRVRSIVGRFLEHSRIYNFANGAGTGVPAYYIGSADLMPRNLDRRVEAVAPVEAPALQARIDDVLTIALSDERSAWTLGQDGNWHQIGHGEAGSHQRLQELARLR